jgi:hypothetical protein
MSQPLPVLQDTVLDPATVEQLFIDLANYAVIHDILVKSGETRRAAAEQIGLDQCASLLRDGQVRAVQISYTYDGAHWRDTLLRQGDSIRIVRTEIPQSVIEANGGA